MFKEINKIVKTLIVADLFVNTGWGLLGPVFAIFIVQNITGGNASDAAEVAGFASLFYWTVKSVLQIPLGKYLDRNHGEIDDFQFMVLGKFLTALVPFGFLISSQAWHIYAFHVLHAIGNAMVVPSWSAIFTRHIDKGKEAYEWGLRSTFLGFGVGVAGAVGGMIAAIFGFRIILILVGSLTFVSACILTLISKDISPYNHIFPRSPYPL